MNRIDKYVPDNIEQKWQTRWEADGLYNANVDFSRPKHYALTMLPYPSGELHIGHWYAMAPSDARARFMRMRGYNVLFPMGFDAFGLPAENAAINKGVHPKEWTYANIEQMRKQLRSMGAMFDWRREAISSDPEYYRWTQWFFKKLIEHGKAYRKLSPVDWCPQCNTTLAREQVWGDDRHCERCETPVVKKDLEQWFFRTTEYAEELLDFEQIDWPERVRLLQTNWIGRSEGASVRFTTTSGDPIEVFTTRPDTLWGATFMVLAPEHPLVAKVTTADRIDLVESYIQAAIRQSEIQRLATDKEKTGVFTGGYAINPVNNERIPIWIADYVLMTYGTGAIMAVPAHDERDFEFALKYGLPILPVIRRGDGLIKSFVRQGAVNDHFFEAIADLGIPLSEQDTGYQIVIPEDQADEFIQIARDAIKPGQCIEVVGARWVFIFHDSLFEWESIATGSEILERWLGLYPDVPRYQSLMEMLWSCYLYRDVFYHH
jgi:leucyl-tRNA synthetase